MSTSALTDNLQWHTEMSDYNDSVALVTAWGFVLITAWGPALVTAKYSANLATSNLRQ